MMICSRLATAATLVTLIAGLAGCYAGGRAASPDVPTLAIEDYQFNLRRYIGQRARVCGQVVREGGHWGVARLPVSGEFYFHGRPTILVIACGDEPPRLDRNGCITGRVAAEDGTLTPVPNRSGLQDDSPVDREWFLHPHCPRRR